MIRMKGFIDIIIRHRRLGIFLILGVTLLLGYAVTRVFLNADFSTYLRQDDPVVQKYNLIGEQYASKSIALVLIEDDDVFRPEILKLVRDLTDAYENLDEIAYVTSLTNVTDFRKTEWGLEVGRLIKRRVIPETERELKRLRDYVLSKERYVRDLVSEDGKSTVIALRLKQGAYEFEVTKKIKKVTESIASESVRISYGGMPFLMYQMTLLIIETVERLEPIMLFLMIFLLYLGFRKAGGIFFPLLVVAFSIIWTVGLMSVFNISLNMTTGMMPIILIAMGSADGIHIMRRYYEKRQADMAPVDAIKDTFSELCVPITITTLTTMIGFLSLLISNFTIIQQFGIVTALGIFLALVVTFFLFPILLSFSSPKRIKQRRPDAFKKFRFMERLANLVFKNKLTIVSLSGLIAIAAAVIIPSITKDVDWSLCLKKGSKAHHAEMQLRRDFGGTLPVQVLVKGPMKDPFTLKAIRYVERYLKTVHPVGETQSMADVISEMNEAMNGRYVVPETTEGVANLWFLIEGQEMMEQMVKEDGSEGLIQAKLATWETGIMSDAMEDIDRFIEALPERIVVVDTSKASPSVRDSLLRVRSERITENLMLDLRGYKIDVEREKLDSIIRAALRGKRLKEEGYAIVRQKVIDYLLSDQAEVASISKKEAEGISTDILEDLEKEEGIEPGGILNIVESRINQHDPEDIKELASSLGVVVREAVGDVRVASVLEQIRMILPPASDRFRYLFQYIKGDLWEMNEDLIALRIEEYKGLPATPEPPKIREVPISFESAGLAAVLKRMEEELIPSQLLSLFIALVLVAVVMVLIYRSLVIGLIAIVPISLTILVNFAVMGYFRIGLDSFTSMIASIAIGLGIDTDVHFISCFKREFSNLGDELKALKKTFTTTGTAILINAVTVGSGFAVLLFAGGQHVRRFGGLVALTVIVSAIFTFTVLPALLMVVKPKFLKKEKE